MHNGIIGNLALQRKVQLSYMNTVPLSDTINIITLLLYSNKKTNDIVLN
jgi:hypothetical protein